MQWKLTIFGKYVLGAPDDVYFSVAIYGKSIDRTEKICTQQKLYPWTGVSKKNENCLELVLQF